MIQPVLKHNIWIAAPRERTWHAITETEHIKQWWSAEGYAEITEVRGGSFFAF